MKKSNEPPSSLSSLIDLLSYQRDPWGIKDTQSRHLYMNTAALQYTDTPLRFSLEGKLDGEFPAAWAEYCREAGLDNDIPPRLLEKGIQFI